MQSGPLRGRSEPMQRALGVVRAARQHESPGLVLVSGAAGIGKSALVAEVCRQAQRLQVRPVIAACDPIGQVAPGAPVIAALCAGHDPLVSGEQYERIVASASQPLLLVERIAAALEGAVERGPVLIALDDVQWADRVSRFVMRTLFSRLLALPVVWLLASREDEADLLKPVFTRVEQLRLAPLSTADLAAIAQDRLGRVPDERTRRFLEATAGNPMLATEILDNIERATLRAQRDTVPEQFSAAIARRLSDLPRAARDLVEVVAVAGRPLPVHEADVLSPAAPGHDGALAAALDSGLITMAETGMAARHELVRDAVCAAMPEHAVRALHLRFARHHLEAGQGLLAASHARAAAVPGNEAAAEILIAAAEQLVETTPADAGELAALAFQTLRPAQDTWVQVGRRCLAVLCRTQRPADAIALADTMLARLDERNLVGAVEVEAARALWLGGKLDELLKRVTPVLAATPLDPAVAARLTAARALANTRILTGDSAAREAAAALENARVSGDRDALTLALHAVGEAARNEGRHQDALGTFRELRALAGPYQLAEEITTLQFLDRYDHAQRLLEEVRSVGANGAGPFLPALHAAQMWQDFNLGRVQQAASEASVLLNLGQQLGHGIYALDALIVQTSVDLLRGDLDNAAQRLSGADEISDADEAVRSPGLTVIRGWLAGSRGDLGKAVELLGPVVRGAGGSCSYWPMWPCWMALFFEVGRAAADNAFLEVVVRVAELSATRNPGVASFEGMALNLRGRHDRDAAMIAQGAHILARSPRPLLRGYGADCHGRALLRTGDQGAAVELLDQAWDLYHQVDARVYREGVECALRGAGVRRAKWSVAQGERPETGWASLTDAERRVALLIADGHSNRSAAGELGVSVNTVGTHLRMVFGKLGVQSRVQLANALRRSEPSTP